MANTPGSNPGSFIIYKQVIKINYGLNLLLEEYEKIDEKIIALEYGKKNNIYVSNNTDRRIEMNKRILSEINRCIKILQYYLQEYGD